MANVLKNGTYSLVSPGKQEEGNVSFLIREACHRNLIHGWTKNIQATDSPRSRRC
jgi:hypothetical protein